MSMMWEKVRFTDIVQDITGGNPKILNNDYLDEGKFPVIDQGSGLIGGYTNENSIVKREKDIVVFGDHTKAIKFIDFDFCLGADGVKVLQPYDKLDSKFLYYFLHTIQIPDVGYSRHFKFLKELQIPLPPLPIQKRIAEILDTADALRRKDEALLKKYDELAQAIFIDMFGDPVKNEKGWEVKKLGDFGKIQTGNTPPRENKEYYGSFIEWIKTDNISLNKVNPNKATEFLSELGLKKGRSVNSGSVLVTCIAGSANSIGNVALTDRKVAFNQQINSLSPNNNYDEFFVYSLFRNSKKLIQESTTVGMKRIITKSVFEKLELISPPLEIQKEYTKRYKTLLKTKEAVSEQSILSINLFNSLLQKAFNGELIE